MDDIYSIVIHIVYPYLYVMCMLIVTSQINVNFKLIVYNMSGGKVFEKVHMFRTTIRVKYIHSKIWFRVLSQMLEFMSNSVLSFHNP
jgi:hypothetical protein